MLGEYWVEEEFSKSTPGAGLPITAKNNAFSAFNDET